MIEASFRELILERDNVNVMKAIMAPCTNRSRLGHIFEDVYYFRAFSISHVRRTANSVAHSLAKFAKQINGERI